MEPDDKVEPVIIEQLSPEESPSKPLEPVTEEDVHSPDDFIEPKQVEIPAPGERKE